MEAQHSSPSQKCPLGHFSGYLAGAWSGISIKATAPVPESPWQPEKSHRLETAPVTASVPQFLLSFPNKLSGVWEVTDRQQEWASTGTPEIHTFSASALGL
jgi:hypothetical protein